MLTSFEEECMTARIGRLSAVVGTLAVFASPALAQMLGNPVYFFQNEGTGLTLAADYGRGLNDASVKTNYFGGRATLGLPAFAITAGGGSEKPSGGSSATSFGGGVAVNVLKAPALPVTLALQAGAAYSSVSGDKTLRVPLGAALAFKPKTPGATVTPWIGPRVDIMRFTPSGGTASTETHVGASAGLSVGLPTGLGFHVALDYTYVKGAGGFSSSDLSPFYVGAGVHYAIKIPSLGVPMVP
jgi:hypothetical protein